mmetsp:Transcript_10383/g.30129  ORF Transcript_10383/g.30129 Transcript_10383/m.30129 type:complete len:201 (-) Transcript_10383:271-873(-)
MPLERLRKHDHPGPGRRAGFVAEACVCTSAAHRMRGRYLHATAGLIAGSVAKKQARCWAATVAGGGGSPGARPGSRSEALLLSSAFSHGGPRDEVGHHVPAGPSEQPNKRGNWPFAMGLAPAPAAPINAAAFCANGIAAGGWAVAGGWVESAGGNFGGPVAKAGVDVGGSVASVDLCGAPAARAAQPALPALCFNISPGQ